jgi:hypothetical protein
MRKRPKKRPNPLEKYLVRNILIIDAEEEAANRLSGLLSELAGKAATGVKSGTVTNLQDAHTYISKQNPDVAIIDPSIDSISTFVAFMRRQWRVNPNVVWVIYAYDLWWRQHAEGLRRHRDTKRLLLYYRMSKNLARSRVRADFSTTLMKCNHDRVLRLLKESTEAIRKSRKGNLTREQVRKFIDKARQDIDPLSQLAAPAAFRNIAFVALRFSESSKNRYTAHIKPILDGAGYTTIMMDAEFEKKPIPASIREHIAECSLFVADLTGLRPNTLIECGAAWIKDTPMILLAHKKHCPNAKIPLLLRSERIHDYSSDEQLSFKLQQAVHKTPTRKSVL